MVVYIELLSIKQQEHCQKQGVEYREQSQSNYLNWMLIIAL